MKSSISLPLLADLVSYGLYFSNDVCRWHFDGSSSYVTDVDIYTVVNSMMINTKNGVIYKTDGMTECEVCCTMAADVW